MLYTHDNRWNAVHVKTGKVYTVIGEALNCTNAQDSQMMLIYTDNDGLVFVRELSEFKLKFKADHNG